MTAPRLHVLIVDDIPESRLSLRDVVVSLGHHAVTVGDGAQALELVARQPPDVVLLDLLMPGLNGFEVARRIRSMSQQRWLPVIVVSSMHGDDHFCEAMRQGADDFLLRPVNPALLDARLRHFNRVLGLQRELGSTVQRQRDIHNNIREAVLTFDDDGCLVDANHAAGLRFGDGDVEGLIGRDCEAVTGVGIAELLSGRELTLLRADGRPFPAEVGHSAWRDGRSRRDTVIVRDLTEQREVERLKDEFLASVSHELRTPLTSILGAVALVAAGKAGAVPAAAGRLLEMADRNARRLSRLIDDLLDLTKLESDRMTMHPREVALCAMLSDAMEAHRTVADRAGVRLRGQWDEALHAQRVRVDPDRFHQVMTNLLSNAIKHAPAGSEVIVAAQAGPSSLAVSVRDFGPGLPAEFRQRVFQKFSQADGSDQREKEGTGLGLYIARQLVERMGGRIGVATPDGPGCEMLVSLPRLDVDAAGLRPQLWVVDRDSATLERVRAWAGPRWLVRLAPASLQAADGERPSLLLADPLGQGDADAFCAVLHRLADGAPVVLYSDAVDEAYVAQQRVHWLKKSGGGREGFLALLRRLVPGAERRNLS